ncbi:uncharacterized protein LOC132347254 isoform X2 [Balaenoptera ricei]|uniref:uncharacterized protein LOC132347254 isoform X2 n=1 Tax=Balaenoptera ricei TaxID=2746895 RepID=UPI0028BDA2F8|nr:uncharacterized protein LOC132347254 isoform X2 [Balaenoptera ricei]
MELQTSLRGSREGKGTKGSAPPGVRTRFSLRADGRNIQPGRGPHARRAPTRVLVGLQDRGSPHTMRTPGAGEWNQNDAGEQSKSGSALHRVQVVAAETRRDRALLTSSEGLGYVTTGSSANDMAAQEGEAGMPQTPSAWTTSIQGVEESSRTYSTAGHGQRVASTLPLGQGKRQ